MEGGGMTSSYMGNCGSSYLMMRMMIKGCCREIRRAAKPRSHVCEIQANSSEPLQRQTITLHEFSIIGEIYLQWCQ